MGFFPKHFFLLIRRIAALSYDVFLLFSVLFVIGAIAVLLNQGQAVNPLILAPVSLLVSLVFFSWFWNHGGQTLGMRAWQIKLTDRKGNNPGWTSCLIRFVVMVILCGAGTLWIMFNRDAQSLQDILSSTRMHKNNKKAA